MLKAARRFAPLALIVVALAAVYFSGLGHYFTFDSLRENERALQAWVAAHPVLSVAAYVGVYAAICALCLPFNLVTTLAGGLLFGTWLGGGATVLAGALGSLGAFYAARSAIGGTLMRMAKRRGGALQKLVEGFGRNAFLYVLSLRLAPVFPFWFVSLAAGVAAPPLWAYVLGTALGIIPACFIYAGLGSGLGRTFASGEPVTAHLLLAPHIVLPLAGLALLSLAPTLWSRFRKARA